MNFGFAPEEESLRKEVQEFLAREVTSSWRERPTAVFDIFYSEGEEGTREHRLLARKLGARGWLSLLWPEEYGGKNSLMLQLIVVEEVFGHRSPGYDIFGAGMIAPTLLKCATQEQKRRFLPDIAQGEVIWCEGLSEPGHGSDLASAETFAREDGDSFIINGQKIWTSAAHCADWMALVARTDREAVPKHRGISFFLVDMKSPGITVRPIANMAGQHEFNEVFFDDVRVPKENVLGEKNGGWKVVMTLLDFERSSIPIYAIANDYLAALVQYARDKGSKGTVLRNRLSGLAVECEIARLLHYRAAWIRDKGAVPNYESAVNKLFTCELNQRLAAAAMELLGLHGQLVEGSPRAPLHGQGPFNYLRCVGNTLEMGTSEIDRDIIAQRGLGLPRG
ncbi:MAG: acyl-CoA dehydrogenase family protein [Chloroflexota bacterium]